jgi:ribose transport system substrate-binding protein
MIIRSLTLGALLLAGTAAFAGPEVVDGPGADPDCFAPWSEETKYLQWEPKEGPYRIAIVNGFVGNTWRIQMIKTAKAFAEDPAVKDKIAELKVV